MALLHRGLRNRFQSLFVGSETQIPLHDQAVVQPCDYLQRIALVEGETDYGRVGLQYRVGFVGRVDVPYLGCGGHGIGHLLELEDGIGRSQLAWVVRLPVQARHCAFDLLLVLQQRERLGVQGVCRLVYAFAHELFLEEIQDIVVLDGGLHGLD